MPPVLAANVAVVLIGARRGPAACPNGPAAVDLIPARDESKAGAGDAVHRIGLDGDGNGLFLDVVLVAVVLRIINRGAEDKATMKFVGRRVQDGVSHFRRPNDRVCVRTDGPDEFAGVP